MISLLESQGLPPGTMVDGWRVVSKLGAGGFGAVHRVEKNGRPYALKLALHPEHTPDDRQTHARTLRELMCLLLLEHPNIVRVLSHGRWPDEAGGHLYLVLEFIEGWTLAQWRERTHPTFHEIIRVFLKLATAIVYMHARGIFHRDLKLLNVLIRKSDGEPILIDFGAAVFTQAQGLTNAGLPPGTERYRAPEANRWWHLNRRKPEERYDFRVTDELFAFGVMLHDALTDPCPTENRLRTEVNSIFAPPLDPLMRNPRIPAALASLVRRLLARDPAHRPEDFEALRRELTELLEHQGPEYKELAYSPSAQEEHSAAAAGGARLPQEAPAQPALRRVRAPLAIGGVVGAVVLMAAALYATRPGEPPPPREQAPHGVKALEPSTAVTPPSQGPGPASIPEAPPASAPPARESGPIVSAPLPQEKPTVKKPKNAPPPASQTEVPRFTSEAEFLKWCKTIGLGSALAVNAGCPGAQLRPEPRDCPADAVKAMKERGIEHKDSVRFTFHPNWRAYPKTASPPLKGGRVEATVLHREGLDGTTANLPPGTRLFGELWPVPDKEDPDIALVRFYRAQLPGGSEFPVCVVASDDGTAAVEERPEPGVVRLGAAPNGMAVYYFR